MFVEFHDLNGDVLMVNFGAILYLAKENEGSVLCFTGGTVLAVKESVAEVVLNLKTMAMQNAIKGGR